jgi:hypothetical protein
MIIQQPAISAPPKKLEFVVLSTIRANEYINNIFGTRCSPKFPTTFIVAGYLTIFKFGEIYKSTTAFTFLPIVGKMVVGIHFFVSLIIRCKEFV